MSACLFISICLTSARCFRGGHTDVHLYATELPNRVCRPFSASHITEWWTVCYCAPISHLYCSPSVYARVLIYVSAYSRPKHNLHQSNCLSFKSFVSVTSFVVSPSFLISHLNWLSCWSDRLLCRQLLLLQLHPLFGDCLSLTFDISFLRMCNIHILEIDLLYL